MVKNWNERLIRTYIEKQEAFKNNIREVLGNERGAGAVEYGLIIAVVVAMVIAAALTMEGPLKSFFDAAVQQIMSFMGSKKF